MPTAHLCPPHPPGPTLEALTYTSLYRGLFWAPERAGDLPRVTQRVVAGTLRPVPWYTNATPSYRCPRALYKDQFTGHLSEPEVGFDPGDRAHGPCSVRA